MWDANRCSLLAFGFLVADQAFDLVVELVLPLSASLMFVAGWLGITHFDGPSGGALDTNGFFTVLAIVLIPFFVRPKMRPIPDTMYGVGMSLMIGGLLGNLADGLRVGYPVDYLVIGRPVNLADIALLFGLSVLLYRM